MSSTESSLNLQPRILYLVAKAAWEGNLLERRQEICQMVLNETKDQNHRRYIANQIRIAMGLDPHDSDQAFSSLDEEALMGLEKAPGPVIVANQAACELCLQDKCKCEEACPLGAITKDEYGKIAIDHTRCTGEGHCINACSFDALAEKSQFVPLLQLLKEKKTPILASVAPAFAGQFGEQVTAGKLRSALLRLGFTEMVETALYADLVTMKEAFEFDEHVKDEHDFMITSCCCPVWIKLIENKFPELADHISPSVSPMIASGRMIKALNPSAKVVFIGPCVAKKTEIELPDLKGAIDYVLTFKELSTIFEATEIDPANEPDNEAPTASWAGRVYGHTGGVSGAVGATLKRLVPHRAQSFKPVQVDGVVDCQKMLEKIKNGDIDANFIEGMACKGGCVGGPGRIIDPNKAASQVDAYANEAIAHTPAENPKVYTLLSQLGHSVDKTSLTGHSPAAELLARNIVK
jgi:iron only hydrogenase large subunit-like protein